MSKETQAASPREEKAKRPYFKREVRERMCAQIHGLQAKLSELKVPKKLVAHGFLSDVQTFKMRADEAGRLTAVTPTVAWTGRKLQSRLAELSKLDNYFRSMQ